MRLHPLLSLLLHGVWGRVIYVGLAFLQKFLCQALDAGKVVAGVGELVGFDL